MMQRLPVALIANSLGVGGVERQLITLAGRLDPVRFDVELVPLKDEGGLHEAAAALPLWSPAARRGIDLGAARRLSDHLRRRGTRAVMAANQYATLMLWAATAGWRAPLHRLSAFHSSPDLMGSGFGDRLRLAMYGHALRRFDGLIYVSDRQQQAWQARGLGRGVRSHVITNGIEVARYPDRTDHAARAAWGWHAGHFVVGLCAALRPEKRVEDLVEAAAIAMTRGVPVRLLLIGDGPCRPAIEAAAAACLPAGTLHCAGFQPDVVPFVQACDAMALVSDTEAFSIAVLEAMACAKPVVLTDVGGASEQIDDGVHGWLVERRRPDQIAGAIERLWRGDHEAMGRRGRERVLERFSMDGMVRRYEDALTPGTTAPRVAAGPQPAKA